MEILFTDEIKDTLLKELETARDSVQIVTAYCKQNALEVINAHIGASIMNKRLLVRFRLDDLLKGATDFSIYEFCKKNKWDLFIRFDLHAKTYIVDNKRCIIGSANLSNKGIQLSKHANYEIAALGELSLEDSKKINNLFDGAIYVSQEIAEKLEQEIEVVRVEYEAVGNDKLEWSDAINQLGNKNCTVKALFSYEFPESKDLASHVGNYISFLDMSNNCERDEIKKKFRRCNAYLWLLSVLAENSNELYFGTLTQLLHDTLVEDPRPYRKDVKVLLINLLGWINELDMEEVIIDRPGHSQRLRIRN